MVVNRSSSQSCIQPIAHPANRTSSQSSDLRLINLASSQSCSQSSVDPVNVSIRVIISFNQPIIRGLPLELSMTSGARYHRVATYSVRNPVWSCSGSATRAKPKSHIYQVNDQIYALTVFAFGFMPANLQCSLFHLVACTRLYTPLCLSVHPSVSWSVSPYFF